jgi:CubicO group peptidase (beta-lactamase class C family)
MNRLLILVLLIVIAPSARAGDDKGPSAAADIAGLWDTSYGFATIHTAPSRDKKVLSVTGFYLPDKKHKGLIKSGTFDPATGVLEFAFEEPWQGDSKGTAKFTLDADGNHFKGSYKQGGLNGDWNMTRVRGKDFAARVDYLIADAGIKADTPGAAVLVLDHGQVVFEKCYGLANVKDKKPITPRTTFELASCSKQFAGTAILLMSERGQLGLDDDVRKYLPELPEYDRKNPIRISHLQQHTSGLPEYMDFPNVKGKDPTFLSNEDYVGEFARQRKKFPLYFPTGTKYRYTNTNYLLLALIVERVSKQSYGAFLKSDIFDPLGMKTATVFETPKVSVKEPALGYHREQDTFQDIWGPTPFRQETLLTVGDGGIWASLDDLARWDEGWRKGKILKAETVKQALVPSKFGKDEINNYAFGWGLSVEDGKLVGMAHNGSWGGFHTWVSRDLEEERTVIVLSNGDNLDTGPLVHLCQAMPPKGK